MSNMYFRLLMLLIRLRFMPKVGFFDAVTMPMRAWLTDIDLNLHVNNSRYLGMMDLGRVQLMGQMGLLGQLFRRKWTPIAQAVDIRYIRDIKPFARFTLETQLLGWDDKYWYIEQRFVSDKTIHAVAFVRGLFLHGHHKVPITQLADLAGVSHQSPPLPEVVQRWRAMREVS